MIKGRIIGALVTLQNSVKQTFLSFISIFLLLLSVGLPYLGASQPSKAAPVQISPLFTCWEDTLGSTVKVFFGYHNESPETVEIAVGTDNFFSGSAQSMGQPTNFISGKHDRAFSTEIQKGQTTTWNLTGLSASPTFDDTSKCPVSYDPNQFQLLNSPRYIQPDTETVVAEVEATSSTTGVEFIVDGDQATPVRIITNSGPSRPGYSLWRLSRSLSSGAHTIQARAFVQGIWFDIPGISSVYAVGSQDLSITLPSATQNIFNPSVNPLQVRVEDSLERFKNITFTLYRYGAAFKSYTVQRSHCIVSELDSMLCSGNAAPDWSPLPGGTYTAKITAAAKSGVSSVELTSVEFIVDAAAPQVSDFKFTQPHVNNTYGEIIPVSVRVTDQPQESGVTSVTFFLTQKTGEGSTAVCDPESARILETSAVFNAESQHYTADIDSQLLNGSYCIFATAIDKALNRSTSQSLSAILDNIVLGGPQIQGWNVKSMSDNLTRTPVDLACDPNGVYVSRDRNLLNQVWSSVEGNNIKYIRRVSTDNGLSWNELRDMVFTTPHMNNWFPFEDNDENAYFTSVLAFDDLNDNNKVDDGTSFVSSWSPSCKITYDKSSPALKQVSSISSPAMNKNLLYSFSISDNGNVFKGNENDIFSISYGGSCRSETTTAVHGDNTILLSPMDDGTYTDCTVTVADKAGNKSPLLQIPSFTVDNAAPVLTEVTPVRTITNDATPDFVFSSTESGRIEYAGQCTSLSQTATSGENAITFARLTDGTYGTCLLTVIDNAGNVSAGLAVSSFTVDTTVPQIIFINAPVQPVLNRTLSIQASVSELHHKSYFLGLRNGSGVKVAGPGLVLIPGNAGFRHILSHEIDTRKLQLADGTYQVYLYAEDRAGNISEEKMYEFALDNTGPVVSPLRNTTVAEGSVFSFDILAKDPNNAFLTIQFRYTSPQGEQSEWHAWGSSNLPGYPNGAGEFSFFPHLNRVLFDSSQGGAWQEGTYEYRYVVRDSLGNYSDSGNTSYNFIEGANAYYARYSFKNVVPQVSVSLYTTGKITEGVTDVEFLGAFRDPSYISGAHSSQDPAQDMDFLPPADDAPWYVTIDYGDGTIYSYFDYDSLKMWRPDDIQIPNHIYKSDGTYTVTVKVSENPVSTNDEEFGGSGEYGIATANVVVGNFSPTVQIMPGISDGTLFAYVSGGNQPLTFTWKGDCTGFAQSATYPSEPGIYTCQVTVRDVDGDISVYEYNYSINAPALPPVSINQEPAITPEAAYTINPSVLGTSVSVHKNTNSYDIEANSGSTVKLNGNSGMCTSLEEITFKTVNGVRGKVFVYQHNKNTFTRTPYQNREFVYDVCEIVLDGIKSEDITDITASLNYKISWLRQNNINQDNVVLFTAENKDKNLEKRITLSRVGSDKDSIKVTAKLGVLPLVYAVAPQEEPKRGPLYLSWWIGSGIGVAGLLCGAVLFVRKKSS